jgi:Holliday junction resolvasome RuvABC endonuclease subunit
MNILGLDASSTCIGYALLTDGVITQHSVAVLGNSKDTPIAVRCERARTFTVHCLTVMKPVLVVIESPVARFAKSVIPQARVSGAILAALAQLDALHCEATPGQGKQALTGDGSASKMQMVDAAAEILGLTGDVIRVVKGKACLVRGTSVKLTEDEADAIGIALHGATVRVEVSA